MRSREVLGLADWHLLVLFVGLFVVQHARVGVPITALTLAIPALWLGLRAG